MSVNLSQEGLEKARQAYVAAVRRSEGPSSVIEAIVAAYIAAAPSPAGPAPRLGSTAPISRQIAAMAVGDELLLKDRCASNMCRYFGTARRIMGVPDARWTARTMPDGAVKLIRNPNGVGRRDPKRNALAVQLAALKPGESMLVPPGGGYKRGGAFQQAKHQARRILDDQTAEWRGQATTKGQRIIRVGPEVAIYVGGRMPSPVRSVFSRVCCAYGVTTEQIRQPTRGPLKVAQARMEIMRKLRAMRTPAGDHRYSYEQIGAFVNRHYSTVIHAVSETGEADAA